MPFRRLASLVTAAVALLAVPAAGSASAVTVRLAPVEDVSLPFQCDWGYDWEERCFRDDSARLPVGGDVDKVWRAALRFSTDWLRPWYFVRGATLRVYHDAVCLGAGGAGVPCPDRPLVLEAHVIRDADWGAEREVAFDPDPVARATLPSARTAGWLVFDVTELVAAVAADELPFHGLLLRVPHHEERFGRGGPKPPSSSFAAAEHRPRREVTYLPE